MDLYKYSNYREFLKDYYQEKKASDGLTYRAFAELVGINSSSWLMHLINGRKNISSESIVKICKALNFEKKQIQYFELIVNFTQAKNNETKNHYFNQIIDFKKKLHLVSIREDQFEYYSKWYHPVIRSLISKIPFTNNYTTLAKSLLPTITAAEAKRSVQLLTKLELIRQLPDGTWTQSNPLISTGDDIQSLNIVNYHKEVAHLAADAHDLVPREQRDISALTLGVSEQDFSLIRERIRDFRKEILKIASESNHPDRVVQLNFQLFQVSKDAGEG